MNQAALHRLLGSKELKKIKTTDPAKLFDLRLATNSTLINELFFSLYPEKQHTDRFLELLDLLPRLFKQRPKVLQLQDLERLQEGNWYQSEKMAGMQLYVDHFNRDLKGLENKIPYLENLGVNFLHLMPITTRPEGENDGGYAVNSYTQIDKKFGTKTDFLHLTKMFRSKKMFLMLDFVVNHTSDEFEWAKKAIKGDKKYQSYYYIYPDRTLPDAFEKTLPEIFPQTSPGNFTFNEKMQQWVMTVFNSYQWDLNYTNPEVFFEMLTNLVKMVNLGVDIVRFDALAFLWKKLGTDSQNLPEAHILIALFRMCLQVVAPGVILLAEAIVAPNNIVKYFGERNREGNECEIAYNATLMALLWNSIATKKTLLLNKSLKNLPGKPHDATWINYIRCHDDIGLGFDDRYIYEIGWDARLHRKFLLDYFSGKLDWSPATGQIFMYNPKNGDGRITGSAASLLGLEHAIQTKKKNEIKKAIDKIIMMHSIILSYGGIPIIYAGDEIALLNDYSFLEDKNKKGDNRWLNRPQHQWRTIDKSLKQKQSYQSQVYNSLKKLIAIRKKTPIFADHNNLVLHECSNPHILVYERTAMHKKGVLVLCNFDENKQYVERSWLHNIGFETNKKNKNLLSERDIKLIKGKIELPPYGFLWLKEN